MGFNEFERQEYSKQVQGYKNSKQQQEHLFELNSLPNTKHADYYEILQQTTKNEYKLDKKYYIEPLWSKKFDNIAKYIIWFPELDTKQIFEMQAHMLKDFNGNIVIRCKKWQPKSNTKNIIITKYLLLF